MIEFGAAFLEHSHIYGQCDGLLQAGAKLRWVYDPDPAKVRAFAERFPSVRIARAYDEILDDRAVALVAAAAVPSERAGWGVRAMEAGKDYFTDKAPFTDLNQLDRAREAAARTGRKYLVYYSERLHVESSVRAAALIAQGAIGRVIQVLGLGPHRLNAGARPPWFWERAKTGGILCDIGSHQADQFLAFSGAKEATVVSARVANFAHPDRPEFEDFGEWSLIGDNGASSYMRVDWFTPAGLPTWGDCRTVVLGTQGYMEIRKYVDIGRDRTGDHLYLVDGNGERHLAVAGKVGFPFFRALIHDCIERTENAMTQAHAFKAAEISLRAQAAARRVP
ncbi:MAG TPA: Gfo/Idh/MocA family oxidoreductase [Opitutaceae bacterium]|jgi:predicted dehydrogenase|nr:Gfo/Idh/MocA family oxidoreductase [Opitutaceae bacterium]